jgi:hypothetical protein
MKDTVRVRSWRGWLSAGLFLAVATIGGRALAPAGAGVYYDDGVYLALGQSLANGDGYTYANLPGAVPGVKYPPMYPAMIAAGTVLLPAYPANVRYLKALNALLMGLAAGLTFLAFTRAGDGTGRQLAFAAGALLVFSSAQTMTLATVLLSEPLFLVLTMWTLLLPTTSRRGVILVGLGAAAAFLTRSVGIALIAAVIAAEFMARGQWTPGRYRRTGVLALAAFGPACLWWIWSGLRMGDVPGVFAGNYGSYLSWYAADGGGFGSILETVSRHWPPLVTALEQLWMPNASELTANFVLLVIGGLCLAGLLRISRRRPALALFPVMYLAVVLLWPYEPDRFYYAIIPLLTMFAIEGGYSAAEAIRQDVPKFGMPFVALVTGLLVFNSVRHQVRSHEARTWSLFQIAPAATYAPLLTWINENTAEDAVIAAGLDPLVYWETGRKAVPSFQFLATDYLRPESSQERLANQFDEIRELNNVRWVAVIRDEGKAGRTMKAFAEVHPERVREAFEAETGPYTGVVYEVLPPGEAFEAATPPSPQ